MEKQPPSQDEQSFEKKLELANKAKEIYWQHYKELVENLSLEHLEDIAKVLKADNVTFKKEIILQTFKEDLYENITKTMETFWQNCNVSVNLAALELMKDKFKNHKGANWRPTGKSADDQTLPIRVHRLESERKYLQKQIEFQNAKLEGLLQQNAMYRNDVMQTDIQRGYLREQMQRGTVELQKLKSEYQEMIGQVLQKD